VNSPDILIIGRGGQLALSLAERAAAVGLGLEYAARPLVDLSDSAALQAAVAQSRAPFIINSAAYTAVDQAESEPELAHRINAVAPGVMAQAAAQRGARLVHISTDYVFDGRSGEPYSEEAETYPLGVYGETKLAGEAAVRAAGGGHVVVRTAWVYSPFGKNFVKTMLTLAESRPQVSVVDDQIGTPTCALALADGLLAMVKTWQSYPDRGAGETYHLAGRGESSWAGVARETFAISKALGGPAADVIPIPTSGYSTPAARPRNSRLSSAKFERTFSYATPPWQDSLHPVVERLVRGTY
jgi:dTDP-4-dehydrorhamnose reductase